MKNLGILKEIIEKEVLIKEGLGAQLIQFRANSGRLYLTENRIAFRQSPKYLAGFLIFFVKAFKRRFTVNIELKDIKTFNQGKFGMNKNILDIETNDGLHIKFSVNKVESWIEALSTTLT